MRRAPKLAIAALLLAAGVCAANAQDEPQRRAVSRPVLRGAAEARTPARNRPLTEDDRLSLIAAALDAHVRSGEPDCSHLVHAIYEQAGFTYAYAPSPELYAGVDGFQRVKKPQPGDLIVWRGHAGIVIKPSQHVFFSYLSTGPGIDDYTTPYWKHRGGPRFYRYVTSFGPQPSPQLVRTRGVRRPPSDQGANTP